MPYSYKIECPQCGGDNFSVIPEYGTAKCWNCGYKERKGNHDPIKIERGPINEIRALYKTLTDYYHSNIDKKVRKYLLTRGITDSMIETYKLGYCPPNDSMFLYRQQIATDAGVVNHYKQSALGNRVIFPYIHRGTVVDLRGRTIDPNEEVRYKSPHNPRYYRGADYLYGSDNTQYPHILVEGEFKRIIVESLGIRACAMPGITIDYDSYKPGKVIICLDREADTQKQHDVNMAIHRLAAQAVEPYVMTLPLMGEKKMGADDVILRSKEEFLLRYNAAVEYHKWKYLIT